MDKHFNSILHKKEEDRKKLAKQNVLRKNVEKAVVKTTTNTENLLKIAYSIALYNRPFIDYQKLIELCESLGMKFCASLRNRNTCARIIDCIAKK